ncbi:MAG TPA: hypothetical protein VHW44_20920 [Pseudonocardiaceae bacterium]|jgi:hypothetical protein|nr:hypothetical protein [Pseudonocardiaceae bacterium]
MRLLRGRAGWWYIGRSGTALVPESLVHNGELTGTGIAQLTAAGLDRPAEPDHYSLTLVTATACNLSCPYCFQNTATGTRRIARAVLGPEVIAAALAFTVVAQVVGEHVVTGVVQDRRAQLPAEPVRHARRHRRNALNSVHSSRFRRVRVTRRRPA